MSKQHNIEWRALTFSQLSTNELFDIMKLRVDVFVVEQNCPYPELDAKDKLTTTVHLAGYIEGELALYTRLLDKNVSYNDCYSIGRVIVAPSWRQARLGDLLMQKSIHEIGQHLGSGPIQIGAQYHLRKFYQKHGFVQCSEVYDEDGIEHIDMLKTL
jgi:ElaA protein